MTTRSRRPLIPFLAWLAIALLSVAPRSYARPQAEPPAADPQPQSGQQAPAQQPQPAAPSTPPSPTPATGNQKPTDGSDKASQLQADQGTKDRLFFALPNFLSLENSRHGTVSRAMGRARKDMPSAMHRNSRTARSRISWSTPWCRRCCAPILVTI